MLIDKKGIIQMITLFNSTERERLLRAHPASGFRDLQLLRLASRLFLLQHTTPPWNLLHRKAAPSSPSLPLAVYSAKLVKPQRLGFGADIPAWLTTLVCAFAGSPPADWDRFSTHLWIWLFEESFMGGDLLPTPSNVRLICKYLRGMNTNEKLLVRVSFNCAGFFYPRTSGDNLHHAETKTSQQIFDTENLGYFSEEEPRRGFWNAHLAWSHPGQSH
ncbi:hypothetical protein B0H19DRAFT_1067522 [Mycena capillaripes]|nr:hypothetical protein B0H19DRAFT_1067522 [Mycena capillaripes]